MRNKATEWMYDSDGSGRPFYSSEAETTIVERLNDRGIYEDEVSEKVWEEEWEKESQALVTESENDYSDYLADQAEAREYYKLHYYD